MSIYRHIVLNISTYVYIIYTCVYGAYVLLYIYANVYKQIYGRIKANIAINSRKVNITTEARS